MKKILLSLGHGYSAQALARLLPRDEWHIIATTRDADKAARLTGEGVEAILWPGTDLTPYCERATHVLASIAPGPEGDPVLREVAAPLRAAPHLEWVGYLSTTGVYGDHQGNWVDEDTPLTPSTRRGMARKQAELAWGSFDLPLHIFRLAGIYGPGRGPFSKVRKGTARRIIKENQLFSRIHVDDIAQVLLASITRPRPGAVYNVCDDDPAPPQDVIAHAAELLHLPIPPAIPIEQAEMSPMARSFYAESKKVRNDLIKDELNVDLIYPTYRDGLAALLAIEARD